jgi:DNA-binding winged helix-turn-helix (wHTH) protein
MSKILLVEDDLDLLKRVGNDVFSVELLLQRICPSESESTAETVRVCIARLRNKIDSPEGDSIIRTVTRIGYKPIRADVASPYLVHANTLHYSIEIQRPPVK